MGRSKRVVGIILRALCLLCFSGSVFLAQFSDSNSHSAGNIIRVLADLETMSVPNNSGIE